MFYGGYNFIMFLWWCYNYLGSTYRYALLEIFRKVKNTIKAQHNKFIKCANQLSSAYKGEYVIINSNLLLLTQKYEMRKKIE